MRATAKHRAKLPVAAVVAGAVASLAVLLLVVAICTVFPSKTRGAAAFFSVETTNHDLDIAFENDYPALASIGLYPWKTIVEPYRTTVARITPKGNTSAQLVLEDGSAISWRIWRFEFASDALDEEQGDWVIASEQQTTTPTLEYVFTTAGRRYRVEAALLRLSDGTVLRYGSEEPVCKYVRREVHSLTDRDRAHFLDALYVMHTLAGDDGRRLYGPRFTSYEELTVQHLSNWHLLGCSPYHAGDVFFTAHAAFSSVIEESLQSIQPATSLPWWDFTYEGELLGSDWHTSELFAPRWFGRYSDESDATGEEYVVRNGPLSYLKVVESAWGPTGGNVFGDDGGDGSESVAPAAATATAREAFAAAGTAAAGVAVAAAAGNGATAAAASLAAAGGSMGWGERNSYGRVTDWQNNSPGRLVARSRFICGVATVAPLPTCDTIGHVLSADSLYDLNTVVGAYIHNYIHAQLGGAWECPAPPAGLLEKYPDAKTRFAVEELLLTCNMIWDMMTAAGMIDCPAHCDDSTPFSECQCHCPALDVLKNPTLTLKDAWGVLNGTGIPSFITRLEGMSDFISWDGATGQWYFDSGSPEKDTDFGVWLAEFACSPAAMGPLSSPFAAPNDPLFGITHVTFVYYWDFKRLLRANGLFFDNRWSDDNSCSWGHHWDSTLPFLHVAGVSARDGSGGFTNGELVELFWPHRLALPYVYDDFEFQRCRAGWDDAGISDGVFGRTRRGSDDS